MAYISKWKLKNGTIVPTGSNLFGTCSTASGTATKVVSLSDFDVLVDGVTVHVLFDNKNTAVNASLQVGSTSASSIKYNGNNGGVWEDGALISFTYHGGVWHQNDYQAGGGGGSSYGLDYDPDTSELSLVPDGQTSTVTLPNGVTYTLSISGDVLTLTGSDGSTDSVTIPDDDTTYTLSINNHSIELVGSDSTTSTVVLPIYALSGDDAQATLTDSYGNTSVAVYPTYTIYKNYDEIVLAREYGGLQTEVARVTDDNTTYGLRFINGTLTLVASGGTASVSIPDTNTTYSLSISGSTLTLTGSDGSTSSVTISGGNIVDVQVNGTSVVDAQGVANIILPEEIFFAEYNVTSFADITSAINDGKAVYAVYSNYIAPLVHTSSGSYVFSMTYDPGGVNPQAVRFIVTSADVWSYNLSALALYSDITSETDPIFTASPAHGITATDITNWNGKSKVTVTTPTPTITANTSSGTGVPGCSVATKSLAITGEGKVATLYLGIKKTSVTNAGGNAFKGTLSNYRPKASCFGVGYYGSVCAVLQITSGGAITVRITGAQLPANVELDTSITYVMA